MLADKNRSYAISADKNRTTKSRPVIHVTQQIFISRYCRLTKSRNFYQPSDMVFNRRDYASVLIVALTVLMAINFLTR